MKTYSITVAVVLFIIGVLGFAFKDNMEIPPILLLLDLVLGLWGLWIFFVKRQ